MVRAQRLVAFGFALALALTMVRGAAGQPHSAGRPPPFAITEPAGWNIVAATRPSPAIGTGPSYTLQAGDLGYEVIPLSATAFFQPRIGYWVYFPYDTKMVVNFASSCEAPVSIPGRSNIGCWLAHPDIPVPADQWVMVGNPLSQRITIAGAGAVYTYDPTAGSYVATTTLEVGQGAFVYSKSGSVVTISPPPPAAASPPPTPAAPASGQAIHMAAGRLSPP